MKNFNFLSNLLQRVSAMSGMRAETINYDGQPAVNRRANMTSVLRHCKASDVRVAQEWCESGARVAREWLQKSSARVAQGLRKRVRFAATILVLLFIGVGNAWGETATMAGGTNGTSATVNSKTAIKVGTSKVGGTMTITVGMGATSLTFYAAAWKGVSGLSLNITPNTKVNTTSVSLTADNGVSNNSPFTLSGNESDYKFTITLKNITQETTLTFESSIAKRFVVWGAEYTVDAGCGVPTGPTNGTKTATTQPVSWKAPSPAPGSGYLVAIGATSTPPGDDVKVNSSQQYGDYYVNVVSAGTTSLTFTSSNGAWVAGEEYHWWVRSKCGASDYSAWVAGTAFTIPNIEVNPTAIDGLDYDVTAGGPSTAKTFTVSGSGLTGNLTVALDEGASSKFEISKTSASSGYGNSLTLTPTSGAVSATIWVRLKSGQSSDDYLEQITISGGTATTKEVIIGGEVTACTNGTITYAKGSTTHTGGNAISGSHASSTKICDTNLTLPGETFTTTGYTQDGWATSDGGNKVYNLSATNYSTEGDATLYPHWTVNTYTVSWSVNGSVISTTEDVTYNTTTSTPANPSVPDECTGSTFMGWTATQNYTGDSAPGNMFNGTTPTITGDITFYAVFADEK